MTFEEAHKEILERAAKIANLEFKSTFPIYAKGEIYRADPIRSDKGGLCLTLQESILPLLSETDIYQAHQIGTSAIKKAIVQDPSKFMGLILASARLGQNYFNRYD